jgi:hypothetical protein
VRHFIITPLRPRLMHLLTYRVLFPLSILAWCLASSAQDSIGQPILIEGAWTYRGPRTVIGEGADTTVVVRKETNAWTITFEHTVFPSVNQREAKPATHREGPYIATIDDKELVFTKDGKEVRYTFLCDSNRMILPAFVQKKPGEWVFREDREFFTIKCEQDPFKIPVGKAGIPGVLGGRGFYSFEEAPRSGHWPRAKYLRFLERSDEGQLFERCRLIFDDYGWPRYERIFETGERSMNYYQLRIFLAENKKEQ